jgi:hypothetical protein
MFEILNSLYDTIHTFGILYDTIDIVKEEIKKTKSFDDIKQDLYNIVQSEEPIILNDDGTVIDKLKLDNSIYQLNNLRTDMITWKHNKSKTYYDDDWELINDPDNLPCRNYILYLMENMPENISYDNNKHTWENASNIGFDKEVSVLVEREIQNNKKEIWMDTRLLGKKWNGLFKSISEDDKIITLDNPILKFIC